jgi:hypothetical protein
MRTKSFVVNSVNTMIFFPYVKIRTSHDASRLSSWRQQ